MHHMRKLVRVQKLSHDHRICAVAQHADLYRGDFAVFGENLELLAQFRAGSVVHRFDSLCVLHRHCRDCRHSIAPIRCKRLQVCRYSRAATWIEARNGQENGRDGDGLSMKMTHLVLSFASFPEENSRTRFAGANVLPLRTEKRPALANVRVRLSLRNRKLSREDCAIHLNENSFVKLATQTRKQKVADTGNSYYTHRDAH